MLGKQNQKMVFLICLIGFFGIFSTTISKSPVLPLFVKGMGGDAALLGLLSAFSPLAGILFSFPVGFLADRWGKNKLLKISALIFTSAPLLYLIVGTPWLLIPIRFFHGLATAILGPVAAAIICETYEEKKAQSLGFYTSATLLGRMLAPLLGGLIIAVFATQPGLISYQLVYVGAFILSLPVFFLSLFLKKSQDEAVARVDSLTLEEFRETLGDFKNDQPVLLTALVQMSTYFIYGVFETYLPLYLVNRGVTPTRIGLIFSLQVLCLLISQPLFGRLADRISKRHQIAFGILLVIGSSAAMTFIGSYLLLIGVSLVFGLGLSLSTVAVSSLVAELAKKRELASYMGALSSMMDVGQTLGPLVAGLVIMAVSIQAGFLMAAGFAFFVVLLFVIFGSKARFAKSPKIATESSLK